MQQSSPHCHVCLHAAAYQSLAWGGTRTGKRTEAVLQAALP